MKYPRPDPQDQDLSHLLTQQTLPWIVNGSASEAQRASVAEHLQSCAACRAELEHERRVRDALSLPVAPAPAVEPGLERLFKRLDLADQCEQPPLTSATRSAPAQRSATRVAYALAACVALQAVALTVLLSQHFAQDASPFQALSQRPVTGTDASVQLIRVVPDGRLTLGEWNALLSSLGLQVSSGPNSAGAYAVAPIDARHSTAQIVERLRGTPAMQMVEPIGTTP